MSLRQILRNLRYDESGQDLIEYGLIVGCLGLGAIAILRGVAASVATVFEAVGTTLNSAF